MGTIEPITDDSARDLFSCERCCRKSDIEDSVKCPDCGGLFHEECYRGHACAED